MERGRKEVGTWKEEWKDRKEGGGSMSEEGEGGGRE